MIPHFKKNPKNTTVSGGESTFLRQGSLSYLWGGSAFWGWGFTCPWHCWKADPPVDRMTDTSKNITLPHTSYAGGKDPREVCSIGRWRTWEREPHVLETSHVKISELIVKNILSSIVKKIHNRLNDLKYAAKMSSFGWKKKPQLFLLFLFQLNMTLYTTLVERFVVNMGIFMWTKHCIPATLRN